MTATYRRYPLALCLLTGLFWGIGTAHAAGVEVKMSTLGAGIDLSWPINDSLTTRLGLNRFNYNTNLNEGGIRYDAELDLSSYGLFLDWHPFRGTFRLTAGYVSNDNSISGRASGNLQVGSGSYTNIDLRGSITFDSGAYLGIGWGNRAPKGWSFTADIGVLQQGSPGVRLRDTTGQVSSTDLTQEASQLEDGLSNFKLYPVLGVGVSYSF